MSELPTDHDTTTTTLAELEVFERTGIIEGRPALRLELERRRAQHEHDTAVGAELVGARAIAAERERAARKRRVLLPVSGDARMGMVVSLRGGTPLIVEESESETVEYVMQGPLAFVPDDVWSRHEQAIRDGIRAAHRDQLGEPEVWIIAEPGEERDNLLELVEQDRAFTFRMPRAVWLAAIAKQVPLGELAVRWYRSAIESTDPDAAAFAVELSRRFGQVGRRGELEAPPPFTRVAAE